MRFVIWLVMYVFAWLAFGVTIWAHTAGASPFAVGGSLAAGVYFAARAANLDLEVDQ